MLAAVGIAVCVGVVVVVWVAGAVYNAFRSPHSASHAPRERRGGSFITTERTPGRSVRRRQRRGTRSPWAGWGMTSERAALISPKHQARRQNKRITDAIDMHVQAEQVNDDDDGAAAGLLPVRRMARTAGHGLRPGQAQSRDELLAWAFAVERVTGIEPVLSAWESDRSRPMRPLSGRVRRPGVAVIDPP